MSPRVRQTTAPAPGPVAVIEVAGPGARAVLERLTGRADWPTGRLRLVDLGGVDSGLAALGGDEHATLMPHGGPRIVDRLIEALFALGVEPGEDEDPGAAYPEAASALEARVLDAVARAASPAAVDRLLAQPAAWAAWVRGERDDDPSAVLAAADRLDRLRAPPTVALTGAPNVGKSSLTNCLANAAASVVADLPGTTRDWVEGLAELTPSAPEADPRRDAVALRCLDMPGAREAEAPVERAAIAHAAPAIALADLRVAVADPETPFAEPGPEERPADLFVLNKAETRADRPAGDGRARDRPLAVSAHTGEGIEALARLLLSALELDPLPEAPLWAFDAALKDAAERGDRAAVARLLAPSGHG